MQLSSLTFAAISMAAYIVVPIAADFIAFSGTQCSGNEGANVACDGTCFPFTGRESFKVHISLIFYDYNMDN